MQLDKMSISSVTELLEQNRLNVHYRYLQFIVFLNFTAINIQTILMKFSALFTMME